LFTVSEAVARAALERRESRGAQFREDFQEKSPQLGKINLVLRKGSDGAMQLRQEPLPPLPDYLKQVIEEMK
jgi:succinate dehydrogenase / fumarate reductase flavoprotein subunit